MSYLLPGMHQLPLDELQLSAQMPAFSNKYGQADTPALHAIAKGHQVKQKQGQEQEWQL